MDLYHIWCNLRPNVSDTEFVDRVDAYLSHLRSEGKILGHRLSRRKLGLGPGSLGEFHVVIEVEVLDQLDQALQEVSKRSGPVESLHAAVNQLAQDLTFALYRDFPDRGRERGEEQF